MSIRSAYISALPHPGPPPTCPLPSLPTKKANRCAKRSPTPMKKASPPVVKLPEGYAFVPPPVPLTYPASYHLIPAGPMNARKPKRVVFRTLTNFAEKVRLPKRKAPEVDLADESFCCRGGEMI